MLIQLTRIKLIFLGCFVSLSSCVFAVDKVMPEEAGPTHARWLIDGVAVSLIVPCNLTSGFPTKYCGKPAVTIRTIDEDRRYGSSSEFETIAELSLDGITITSAEYSSGGNELYTRLSTAPAAQLSLTVSKLKRGSFGLKIAGEMPVVERKQTIVLSDFEGVSERFIGAVNRDTDRLQTDARVRLFVALVAGVVVLIAVVWGSVLIFKRSVSGVRAAKENFENNRIRRVAEDEAIRATVRKSVNEVDENELQTLKNQIKAALDAGDTEIAANLMSILKKNTQAGDVKSA